MIIVRSPLRITLGGGGTDLPSYYRDHGGFVIAAAIDRYVYVAVHRTFENGFILKYSDTERVAAVADIRHPLIREALRLVETGDGLEIVSMADIPAGSGLGSSGSFTTALLQALHIDRKRPIQPGDLAELACQVEIDRVGAPVGKQDQYIAAFGGVTCIEFRPDDTVDVTPLRLAEMTLHALEDELLLFFTGYSRRAADILRDQDGRSRRADPAMLDNLHHVKDLGRRSRTLLEAGDLAAYGRLMHEHWEHKRRRSTGMSNPEIDRWYALALDNGASGGKLIGAGGGGFLMFHAEDKTRLRRALTTAGLREVRFRFDFQGTTQITG